MTIADIRQNVGIVRVIENPIAHGIIIALFSLAAYSNSFDVPFHFDDVAAIQVNPLIQNTEFLFSPSTYCSKVGAQSIDSVTCSFFPRRYIGYLTFALDYRLHGLSVAGYHAVNLVIHVVSALLLYAMVRLLFMTPAMKDSSSGRSQMEAALFTALLFAVHPVQTQAVTYIVQRFTSLATFFYLLSLVAYVKWRLNQMRELEIKAQVKSSLASGPGLYLLCLISAVLAMKTKEIAFTLPLMIALCEFSFFKGPLKKRVLCLIPLLLTALIIPISLINPDRAAAGTVSALDASLKVATRMPRLSYLYTEFPVIVAYIRLIFFPVNQNLDYDFPLSHSLFDPPVLLSFLFLLSVAGLGIFCYYRSRSISKGLRLAGFGILWFFIGLSVESSLIPIVDVIFEHRVYLPSVGAFLAIAQSLALLEEKLVSRSTLTGKWLVAACGIVILLLTAATLRRNLVWQDELSLWQDVAEKSPRKARGLNNVGNAYFKRDQLEAAIPFFKKAIERDPKYLFAHNNLGTIYLRLGEYEKAVQEYSRAIESDWRYGDIYNNRGNAYKGLNQFEKAISDYTRAIELVPDDADYHFNRGLTRTTMKDYDGAIADFSRALALNPQHSGAFLQRGMATYLITRDFVRAATDFRKACELGNRAGCEILQTGPGSEKGP